MRLERDARAPFLADPAVAAALVAAAAARVPDGAPLAEVAARVVVANAILNLDEFLTRN